MNAYKHLEKIKKSFNALEKCLIGIRFCAWPTNGLGIGLQADNLDEILNNADPIPGKIKSLKKFLNQVEEACSEAQIRLSHILLTNGDKPNEDETIKKLRTIIDSLQK